MSYTALYRKFRPVNFSEMVGQEHITKTLKNQIIANRVGHAYLLNGGRGTGKTTTAKILARAINCLNPKDGEPCNECEICKEILSGSLTDVVEMDAASNNSVEDIRLIRDEVNFLPTKANYRVYIIDEVHMLSTGAFNALLKTLEEPPKHVKFILATTEPQKLPATILSRCQRFDFKRIADEDIQKRLKIVCQQSNLEITPGALSLIATLSEGAMRDALSILERCVQEGNNKIEEESVKELVGIPKLTYIHSLAKAVLEKDVETALKMVKTITDEGKELTNLSWELIKYIKDILLAKTGIELTIYNEKEIEQLKQLEQIRTKDELMNIIYELSDLENTIKWSSQKMLLFQTGMIKLCSQTSQMQIEQLYQKVEQLERKLMNVKVQASSENITQETSNNEKKVNTPPIAKTTEKNKINTTNLKKEEYWPEIIKGFKEAGKIMLYTNLINTVAKQLNDMTIAIEFPNGLTPFGKTVLEKAENVAEIEKQLSIACGKQMHVKYIDTKQEEKQKDKSIEKMVKELDVPVDIIEE